MMLPVGTASLQQQHAAGRCTGMRSSVVAFARFGRAPSLGDGSSSREGSGLIIPGDRGTRRSGDRDNGAERKLILPNQGAGPRGAPPPTAPGRRSVVEDVNANQLGLSAAVATNVAPAPTSMNKFRPPPGFMDDTSMTTDADILAMDPQDMLNKLRSRAQLWHELCKYIPVLYNRGYDSSSLDELTGLTSLDQNRWVVAGSVFDSLKTSGQVPRSVLDRFNQGGDELLYPFRFLSVQRRITAAEYILEQAFDPEMCDVLARAMKEYERRVTDRVGFTDHPADCLAYKYMRDAIETREAREKRAKFDLALEVVLSDEGRQRILDLMTEKKKEERTSKALFNILRLSRDDIGYRPMAVAGSLTQATAADVLRVARATQEGAFGTFSFVGAGAETTSWVALPQWRALALARYPVALTIPDCSVNQDIVAAAGAKSTEDMRRLQGPAMVVVDRDPQGGLQEPSEEQWYLTADGPGGKLRVQDGAAVIASGARAVAAVLFLCRPPVREVENKGTDMLQL